MAQLAAKFLPEQGKDNNEAACFSAPHPK